MLTFRSPQKISETTPFLTSGTGGSKDGSNKVSKAKYYVKSIELCSVVSNEEK